MCSRSGRFAKCAFAKCAFAKCVFAKWSVRKVCVHEVCVRETGVSKCANRSGQFAKCPGTKDVSKTTTDDIIKMYILTFNLSLALAAYRMQMWEKARAHLQKMLEISPNSDNGKQLLEQTEIRLKESTTGSHDIVRLYEDSRKNGFLDIADYRKLVEVCLFIIRIRLFTKIKINPLNLIPFYRT